jgi:GntR family transcriptional regulator, vanillate catabolism transcriptional regulator
METLSPTRSASVIEQVRAAVLAGEFGPGERLHEARLTALCGVSRTPVRAALQALAAEGLLDYTPNRGYAVRSYPIGEIISAYEVRAVLEGLAARLAAERGLDDDARGVLAGALADGDRLLGASTLTPDDRATYGALNAVIHETILAAAGSRLLGEMVALCRRVPMSSPRNVVAFETRDVRRRHDDHHRIFEALVGREPWRAEMLMRDHVAGVRASLVRSLAAGAPADRDARDAVHPRA